MPIANGTYYIVSQFSGTAWTLVSGDEGTNLTAWLLSGNPNQQWKVSNIIGQQYVFKNVEFGTYVSFLNRNTTFTPYTSLYGSQESFRFVLEEYKGGYLIATQTSGPNVVNLARQSLADNTSVIFWPLTFHIGLDNSVWNFFSTSNVSSIQSPAPSSSVSAVSLSTSTPSNSLSSSAAVIAGSVVGGLLVLAALLSLSFFLGRWSASNFRVLKPFKTPVIRSTRTPPVNPRSLSILDSSTSTALYAVDDRNPVMSRVPIEQPSSIHVHNIW